MGDIQGIDERIVGGILGRVRYDCVDFICEQCFKTIRMGYRVWSKIDGLNKGKVFGVLKHFIFR